MSDQLKPYVHLAGDVTQSPSNMKLRFRVNVLPGYEYYWRNFNGANAPEKSIVTAKARHFEIKGYPTGSVPGDADPALKIEPVNNVIESVETFAMTSITNEEKVVLTIIASDLASGSGQSTSYYLDADDDD